MWNNYSPFGYSAKMELGRSFIPSECVLYTPPRQPRLWATRYLKKTTPTHAYPQLLYYWPAVNRRTHKIKWPCKTLNWDIWKGMGYLPSNEWVLIQDLQEFRMRRKHLGVKASKDSRWRRNKQWTERENDFKVNRVMYGNSFSLGL